MNAYSKDLRLRVLATVDRGVSLATVRRWLRRSKEAGEVSPRPSPGRTSSICRRTAEEQRALWRQLEANREATLERHCELWERGHGVRVSVSTVSRAILRLGWIYKQRRGSR